MLELVPPLAELLPRSIGPYLSLMIGGFLLGIAGHIMKLRWLVAIGVIMVFLATFLFPLALNITTDEQPPVLDYPPSQ